MSLKFWNWKMCPEMFLILTCNPENFFFHYYLCFKHHDATFFLHVHCIQWFFTFSSESVHVLGCDVGLVRHLTAPALQNVIKKKITNKRKKQLTVNTFHFKVTSPNPPTQKNFFCWKCHWSQLCIEL